MGFPIALGFQIFMHAQELSGPGQRPDLDASRAKGSMARVFAALQCGNIFGESFGFACAKGEKWPLVSISSERQVGVIDTQANPVDVELLDVLGRR
jgi:hypothetical protein